MSNFDSLTAALEVWFDRPLADLPVDKRKRVESAFLPMPWDLLDADQRRTVAAQWDFQHDPKTEDERNTLFDLWAERCEIEQELEELQKRQWNDFTDRE